MNDNIRTFNNEHHCLLKLKIKYIIINILFSKLKQLNIKKKKNELLLSANMLKLN